MVGNAAVLIGRSLEDSAARITGEVNRSYVSKALPASETADHGHWTTRQDQDWADADAFWVTVLVLDSAKARPVKVQVHGASLSFLLDLPREQARRLGLALLAAADYDTRTVSHDCPEPVVGHAWSMKETGRHVATWPVGGTNVSRPPKPGSRRAKSRVTQPKQEIAETRQRSQPRIVADHTGSADDRTCAVLPCLQQFRGEIRLQYHVVVNEQYNAAFGELHPRVALAIAGRRSRHELD
jgi:hypothetical protein